MADNVSFRDIPDDIRVPGQNIEIDSSRADTGLPPLPNKIVIVGQKLAAGTAVTTPPTEVQISTPGEATALGGRGSLLAQMAADVFAGDPYAKVTVIAVVDLPAGNAAAGAIAVTGPATESGTIPLYVEGARVQVGVTKGDTAIAIAANIAAQINANLDLLLSVPIAPTTASVAVVARHKGETGNDLDLRYCFYSGERLPAGVGLTITAMSGGSGNPDVGPLLGAIRGDDRIRLVNPWTDAVNMGEVESDFLTRYGPMYMQESHSFSCVSGTFGTYNTYLNSRNSFNSSVLPREGNMISPWRLAARATALAARRGASDPARPYTGMVLNGFPAPAERDRFDKPTRNNLLKNGGSSFRYAKDGSMQLEIIATTYKTNGAGVATKAYFKLQSKWGADYFRYAWATMIAIKFPDYKLANDDTNFAPSQPIVTPKVLSLHTLALYKDLEFAGQVENYASFKQTLLMMRSLSNVNQVNSIAAPDLVNQFDVFAAQIQFIN